MRHALAILVTLSLVIHEAGAAQATGQRVRITARSHQLRQQAARVLAVTADTITVLVEEYRTVHYRQELRTDTLALFRGAIDRLELSKRGGHQTRRGALIGLGIGVVAGFAIGVASYKPCEPQGMFGMNCLMQPGSAGAAGLMGAAGLGVVGVGIGGLIGAMSRGDQWEDVAIRSLPQQRLGLGLAVAF